MLRKKLRKFIILNLISIIESLLLDWNTSIRKFYDILPIFFQLFLIFYFLSLSKTLSIFVHSLLFSSIALNHKLSFRFNTHISF